MAATITGNNHNNDMLGIPSTSLPLPLQDAAASSSSITFNTNYHDAHLRSVRSTGSLRTTPKSSIEPDEGGEEDDQHHFGRETYPRRHHQHLLPVGSLSPPPDLSFSRSSLLSDQEADFLARNVSGSSDVTEDQRQHIIHQQNRHVHIATGSNTGIIHHVGNDSSWGSRHSNNVLAGINNNKNNDNNNNDSNNSLGKSNMARSKPNNNNNSRIRLDSIFGTQLPGFPYLNSAAAATSSAALGDPIHHTHHASSSSGDLLRGRASYNWSERSASAASHYNIYSRSSRSRAATSQSMRSTSGRDSAISLGGQHNPSTQGHDRTTSANGVEIDTSCSGGSNSSDEVDLDLSFDMDLLRARQMQQLHARQKRQYEQHVHEQRQHQQHPHPHEIIGGKIRNSKSGHVGIDMQSDEGEEETAGSQAQLKNDYIDPSAVAAVDTLLGLPQPQSAESEESLQQRRYNLGGKKRLSRSAVELRTNANASSKAKARIASAASASIGQMPSAAAPAVVASSSLPGSASVTPRGGTPIQGLQQQVRGPMAMRNSQNHIYTFRQSGTLSATVRSSELPPSGSVNTQTGRLASKTSLDLTVDMPPLEYEDTSGDDGGGLNNSNSNFSSSLGWSFATTPPLSPAEVVTFAEGRVKGSEGNTNSAFGEHGRRNSAGASGILEHQYSSGNLLRKRRPSFPLMALIDKAIRAPVASIIASGHAAHHHHQEQADGPLQSPDSDRSWGSPTPTQDNPTMIQIQQYAGPRKHEEPPFNPQEHNDNRHARADGTHEPSNVSPSALNSSPEWANDPLPPPPPLHDPALAAMESSPSSSIGTPGTMSPDLGTSQSGFSSPRSPDDIPTPKTGDFAIIDGNRFSQFSMTAASVGGISFTSGSDTLEASGGGQKRESRIFGLGLSSSGGGGAAGTGAAAGAGHGNVHSPPAHHLHLDAIPEQDSPRKSSSASAVPPSSSPTHPHNAAGSSPPSSSFNGASATLGRGDGLGPELSSAGQNGHKRQSSSLFRFPFVSSLRNPFASRPATPSIAGATRSHRNNPDLSPSSSQLQESPATSNEELLSDAALGVATATLAASTQKKEGKRSNSPNSSEESHFQTSSSSGPPSPPRPGATSRAEAAIDPSMLRAGPNTGKGRIAGLGLTFGLTSFSHHNASGQPTSGQQDQTRRTSSGSASHMHQHHHQQRQSSLPVLSFSAASDDHSGAGGHSIESEEAAIHDAQRQSLEKSPRARVSSNASHRSVSRNRRVNGYPASAPATTVHFSHDGMQGLDGQMERIHANNIGGVAGAGRAEGTSSSHNTQQSQYQQPYKRPRTRLLSHGGLDLRGRVDRMRPSQLLFLAAFILGPWCFVIGGWCLRPLDGDHRKVKGVRCRCPDASDTCECKAEVYRQIKLSGGLADLILQMQNGEPRKMDKFVLANRIAALTCGTGSLVLAITALIVLGRAW